MRLNIQEDPNHISLNNRILIEAHYKNISRPSLKILLPMHHLQDDFDKTWKLKNQSSDETDDDDTGFSTTSISSNGNSSSDNFGVFFINNTWFMMP